MKTTNVSSKLLNWRIKLITLLSIFVIAVSLCFVPLVAKPVAALEKETAADWMGGINSRKQWTDYAGWQDNTLNGLQFDNVTYGMFGSNFFLGYDENGNFAVERSSGSGAAPGDYGGFSITSRKPVYADGFSTTFSFEPTPIERGEPEVGGTFAIGLGDDRDNQYAFMYIVFRYNGESLDMYLILYNKDHGYNVDADGKHSCYYKGSLVELSTLATREMAKPKLNEKITLQLKKITKAEADVYNADERTKNPITMDNGSTDKSASAWRWIVNGVVIETPAFSEAQSKGPMFDAYSLPKDANGDYYGYLWADCNYLSGKEVGGLLTSSNIDTVTEGEKTGYHIQKNLSGRLTFYDIVSDGTAGGAAISSSATAMPGTTAGAITNAYTYATATAGQYKDKTTVSSNGAFSFQYTDKVKLNAFDMTLALKKIDQPNGGTFRILLKESDLPGSWSNGKYSNSDGYVGLILRKTAWRSLALTLDINGTEYLTDYTEDNPYVYDFKNGEISIKLFYSEDGADLFFNSTNVGHSTDIQNVIKAFATDQNGNPEGYLYLQNDSGSARVTMAKIIADGTAERKPWVTAVDTPSDTTVEYGGSYSNPEKVTVTFDDETKADWDVTWAVEPDTYSAQTYTVKGEFTNMATLEEDYFISSVIVNALTFKVTVGLDPALIYSESLGTGYDKTTNTATFGPEGYRWYSVYSMQIPYYYKQDEGYDESVDDDGKYEHLMADPSLSTVQFHTSDLVRKDVDGYELEFAIKNHTPAVDPDIYVMLTATPGHPEQIGQGNVGLHLKPSQNQTKMYANLVTWMYAAMGGLPNGATVEEQAYFQKEGEAPVREIDFDFTGKTTYKLKWSLSGEEGSRQVDMTFETSDGTVYKIVDANGNHIDKADYQFNANHEATLLEPNTKFVNDKGYLFFWVEKGYNEIIFRQHYNEYVASYQKPEGKTVSNGTALDSVGLPTTVAMKTNKNVSVTGTVEYTGYDPSLLGPQDVTGTITLPNDYEFEDNVSQTFTVRVTVNGIITAIPTMPADIEIKVGGSYTLPEKYTVTCGDSEQEISLVWVGDCDVLTAGEYVLTANPLGYYAYADGVNPITVKVVVTADENTNPDKPDKDGGCGGVYDATSAIGTVAVLALAGFVCLKKKKEN